MSSGTNRKKYLIFHHTGDFSISSVLNTFRSSNTKVSAHYVVDKNGDIYQIGTEDNILWHCGKSSWDGIYGLNSYSIGIEVLGHIWYTQEQKDSVKELAMDIMSRNDIWWKNVLRHKDIAPGRKQDIDDSFWSNEWDSRDQYRKSLQLNGDNMYYKKLWEDHFEKIPVEDRAFKDPAGAVEKFSKMSEDEKWSELMYLTAIITQKGMDE